MLCDFSGSYYDPSPWTEHACVAENSVPAGCPVDVVTANGADPSGFVVQRGAVVVASSSALVDTVSQTFSLPAEDSCFCEDVATTIDFHRVAISVPDAVDGDVLSVFVWGDRYDLAVTASAPCVATWPDSYAVALACDRCPGTPTDAPTDGGGPSGGAALDKGGCSTSGAPPLALALALLALRRRRR